MDESEQQNALEELRVMAAALGAFPLARKKRDRPPKIRQAKRNKANTRRRLMAKASKKRNR